VNASLHLATVTGAAAAGAVGLEAAIQAAGGDVLAAGPIVGSIGIGATVWAIKELLRLRRDLEEFRRESRHSRRVIAAKLNLQPQDLELPDIYG
jgi:hypothetical protein